MNYTTGQFCKVQTVNAATTRHDMRQTDDGTVYQMHAASGGGFTCLQTKAAHLVRHLQRLLQLLNAVSDFGLCWEGIVYKPNVPTLRQAAEAARSQHLVVA